MNWTIESLEFPIDVKKKLKMKVSTTNFKLKFLPNISTIHHVFDYLFQWR